MGYRIEHYEKLDNPAREDVIEFMWRYNEEFANMEISLVQQANKYLTEDGEELSGREGIVRYYESLCDELIVVEDEGGGVVACRFVEFDKEDEYFRERLDDYTLGLNLTFALVDEDHRGNGLWSKMLEYVENNVFPRYDVDRMYLATATTNEAMQSAATKGGFQCINKIEDDRKNGVGTYIYMKKF
jgi:GNAT superfamily N-acetyltransferase